MQVTMVTRQWHTHTKHSSTDPKTMQVTMVTRQWHTHTKHSSTDLKTRMWQLSERVMMTCLERRSVVEEESNTGMTSSDDCSCPCSRSSRRCTSYSSEPDVTQYSKFSSFSMRPEDWCINPTTFCSSEPDVTQGKVKIITLFYEARRLVYKPYHLLLLWIWCNSQ